MTGYTEEDLGFAEICAVLSERFGTRFALQNAGGNCVTLMAHLEGGIKVLITDCVGTLSPIQWHLDGHAAVSGHVFPGLRGCPSRNSSPAVT